MASTRADWDDLDQGLFSISVAAQLAGLHPQTLRVYEREGLVGPARTAGGAPSVPPAEGPTEIDQALVLWFPGPASFTGDALSQFRESTRRRHSARPSH